MSDTQPHVPEEGTQQLVGPMGNIYEENPEAQREPPLEVRLEQPPEAEVDPAAGLDAAGEAAKVIDAGAAKPDHGKAAGASNALTFHNWDGDKNEGES